MGEDEIGAQEKAFIASESESESESEEPPKKKMRLDPSVIIENKIEALHRDLPWIETLLLTCDPCDVEFNDDLAREVQFYERTQDAVEKGMLLLKENETKWKRPPDYYVEMVKSDKHMTRVKGALLQEKKRMKIVQQRKDNKVSRKFGKQKGLTKQQTRKEREKANIEAINQWKKGDNKNAQSLQAALSGKLREDKKGPGRKRKRKDFKYGKGGQKWKGKRNDGKNLDDAKFLKKQRRKASKNNRPGKCKRQQKGRR